MTSTGRWNDLFFDPSIEALASCQGICFRCPVFRECTRWTLANYKDFPNGTFAGLTEDVRGRIHAGIESYYDWRRDWSKRHWAERIAAKRLRESYRAGERKRIQAKAEMPLCPYCNQQETVSRNGRSVNSLLPDRQRYHCRNCNRNFLGEEL
jgi:hypothetical protein